LEKSIVSIVKTKKNPTRDDIRLAIRRAVDILGGMDKFVETGSKVLVKPNMCWPWKEVRVTTDARITAQVVELCFESGAKTVYVGEGAGFGIDTDRIFDFTGTRKLVEKAGAKVVDFKDDGYSWVENLNGVKMKRFRVARLVKECDALINVPIMKFDYPATFSCALKNWGGILDDDYKRKVLHREGIYWTLPDLVDAVRQDLIIVDGIMPPEAAGGIAREMDLILAGDDPVAVDAVASKTMGCEPMEINITRIAAERGIGNANLNKIEIKGEALEKVMVRYDKPVQYVADLREDPRFEDVQIVDGLACSGCVQALLFAWNQRMKPDVLERLKDLTILIGPLAYVPTNSKKILIVGKCLQSMKNQGEYVDGCIPFSADILKGIKRLYGFG
jgi:uncharacterized protein (DUF362 family)